MKIIIETRSLGKRYGEVTAVENLSLQVAEGEIYAFLGLNGAGKTTTIRMLLGMIKPTSGTAHVLQTQIRLGSREPWASVGYMVETPHAYPELTVYENLEVARRLHPGTSPKDIDKIIERLGLAEYSNRQAGNLSHGNAQRLGLAKALLHQPKLIILDEPANGLDPAGIVEIRDFLLELTREKGVTVFMSSHILAEVSRLARRIGIIHKGHLLQELSIEELQKNRQRRLILHTHDNEAACLKLKEAGHLPEMIPGSSIVLKDSAAIEHPGHIASLLVNAGIPPTRLVVEEEELEQYFLRMIGVDGGKQDE